MRKTLCGRSVLEFMDTVRTVEKAIAADRRGEDVPEELDIASLGVITEEEWRAFWPSAEPVGDESIAEPVEAEPSRTRRGRRRRKLQLVAHEREPTAKKSSKYRNGFTFDAGRSVDELITEEPVVAGNPG